MPILAAGLFLALPALLISKASTSVKTSKRKLPYVGARILSITETTWIKSPRELFCLPRRCQSICENVSVQLDNYNMKNYRIYPEKVDDGYDVYIILGRQQDIESLSEELTDENHLYGRWIYIGETPFYSYEYSHVKADKTQYSVVRKTYILYALLVLSMIVGLVSIVVRLFRVILQLQYFNNNYQRTSKGNILLSKAYALKNFLKTYSLIDTRREAELSLWEYYLVYAVALGVNESIEDEIMEKLPVRNELWQRWVGRGEPEQPR